MPSPGLTATWGRESWSPVLIEALSNESVLLRAGANRVVADGRVIHVPTMKVLPAADWVGELVELPSNAGDADTMELTPKKIGNVVSLSRESIEDSAVAELDAVGNAMVRGVAVKVDDGDVASWNPGPGLELRAVGRQCVAPPSIHPNGHRYAWLDADAALAPLPAWLVKPERPTPEVSRFPTRLADPILEIAPAVYVPALTFIQRA